MDYQLLIDQAMLGIVKKVLINAQLDGLAEDQHFYISFRTSDPGVVLSERVKSKYPKEITVILQYQFSNLLVTDSKLSVNIAFGSVPETIEIPFSAITVFSDPSANFSLQFEKNYRHIEDLEKKSQDKASVSEFKAKPVNGEKESKIKKIAEIVSINQFRREKTDG